MSTVEDMGKKAYHKQLWGYNEQAVELYTSALQKAGLNRRLLNNRCYAYIELKDYKSALADAEDLIEYYPDYARGYYRKGEILMYQKKYREAEAMFKKVLSLDPGCSEAREQLYEAQSMQIVDKLKCSKLKAQRAIALTSNIKDAINLVTYGDLDAQDTDCDGAIYYSDEETDTSPPGKTDTYDPLLDPTNPLQCTTLWVGNLTETLTDEKLKEVFSKFGRIKSSSIQRQRYYAFINYFDPVVTGKTMKALQGQRYGERCLTIKFKVNK